MKKIMLIASGALLFAASASFAQVQDTTRSTTTPTSPTQTQPQTQPQQQDPTGIRSRDTDEDMQGWTRVNSSELPSSLRSTLSDSKYKGWESSEIYRHDADNTYRVRIQSENDRPMTYYFDADGKPGKKPNKKSDN